MPFSLHNMFQYVSYLFQYLPFVLEVHTFYCYIWEASQMLTCLNIRQFSGMDFGRWMNMVLVHHLLSALVLESSAAEQWSWTIFCKGRATCGASSDLHIFANGHYLPIEDIFWPRYTLLKHPGAPTLPNALQLRDLATGRSVFRDPRIHLKHAQLVRGRKALIDTPIKIFKHSFPRFIILSGFWLSLKKDFNKTALLLALIRCTRQQTSAPVELGESPKRCSAHLYLHQGAEQG